VIELLPYILAIAVCVAGTAFFSGGEIAFVSCNRFRISGLAARGSRRAMLAKGLLAKPNTFVSMVLVGTSICLVLASALATHVLTPVLGSYAVPVSTAGMTVLILFFGEIAPKAAARANPDALLVASAPALAVAYYLIFPLAKAMSSIAMVITRVSPSREGRTAITRDEIQMLVKEAAQTGFGLAPDASYHRALDFSRMKVASIMLPMDEVVCIDAEARVGEAIELASRKGYSRYPVYRRTPGDPVGVLNVKDLLGAPPTSKVGVFARGAYFIPETQTIKQAIMEMRDELRHLAVVTDEYGRAIGMLTFEDLVEEIVGEISDEYDWARETKISLDRLISGSTPISVVNEKLDANIPEGPYGTVAGFILSRTGSIPRAGDEVEHEGFRFSVADVKGRRIISVKITKEDRPT
jgi:putative hemolysin